MKLDMAIEILSRMHKSSAGDQGTALGIAVVSLKENLDKVREEALDVTPMIERVLPGIENPGRRKIWQHLRPMLRLSTAVLDEVEQRLESFEVSSGPHDT